MTTREEIAKEIWHITDEHLGKFGEIEGDNLYLMLADWHIADLEKAKRSARAEDG